MIPFTVFSFIVTIISFQRISATINDLVQISKGFDQYFNLPSDNNYTLDYPLYQITVYNIYPIFKYKNRITKISGVRSIMFKDVNVTFLFDIMVQSYEKEIFFTKSYLTANFQYKALTFKEFEDLTFDYERPLFLGFKSLGLLDLKHFKVFDCIFEKDESFFLSVFEKEWMQRLDNTLSEYPKSKVLKKFEELIRILLNNKVIPVECCKSHKIYNVSVSDFKYENVEKIGISYRKFNNIIISLVVKRPKQISFYSVPIDYILVTNDSINFGTFRTQIKYLIDIIHEICEKVFKQIIQIT